MLSVIGVFIILQVTMKVQSNSPFHNDQSIDENGLSFNSKQWRDDTHSSHQFIHPSSLPSPSESLNGSPFQPYESNSMLNSPYPNEPLMDMKSSMFNSLPPSPSPHLSPYPSPMDPQLVPPMRPSLTSSLTSSLPSPRSLIQTPIQRRLFNPINRIILTLLGPRLVRYQMDMVVQAVMSEVIRKMVGPVLTAIAGRFVEPNGQHQSPQLNFGLASALTAANGANQQQQVSIPQLTLVPNQMPNGQIQLIIKPGGETQQHHQQQQQQQQLTNLQQLTQSLMIPVTPTTAKTQTPNAQLYSSAQLQATLDQQISQQLTGKLPAQLIPQVAQQIQAQLQDKLPNIQLQVQQQLASQLANLQQQLGNQATPTTNSPGLTLQSSLSSPASVPVTSSPSNGIQTILLQSMPNGGVTSSSTSLIQPNGQIYAPQSPRSSGFDHLTPKTELNYLSNTLPTKPVENVVGHHYFVKMSPSQGLNSNGQNHPTNQQYLQPTSLSASSPSNGFSTTEVANNGQILNHQNQQIKVVLNPIELSESLAGQNSGDIHSALISNQQQNFQSNLNKLQQQQSNFYSSNGNNNQAIQPNSDELKPGHLLNHLYSDQSNSMNNIDPNLISIQSNGLTSNTSANLNDPDMGQYNNIRNIIEQNSLIPQINQQNSVPSSTEEISNSPELSTSNHDSVNKDENSSTSQTPQSSLIDTQKPESTQESRIPITSYSHGSGYKSSNYPPIPETKYQNIAVDPEQLNNLNNFRYNDQSYQSRSQNEYSPDPESTDNEENNQPESNNQLEVNNQPERNINSELESNESLDNIENFNENENGNNEININDDSKNQDLPEHLKHMRQFSRDTIISNLQMNRGNRPSESGLTEVEEKERAIRWNTVLKNLDTYYVNK